MNKLGKSIVQYKFWIIVITVLILLVTGSGIGKLQFSSDYRDFFNKNDPKLTAFETLQNKYEKTNNVFIAIESISGDVYTDKVINDLINLTRELWTLPYVVRVDSPVNFQFISAKNNDISVFDLTTQDQIISTKDAKVFYKRALSEKGLKGLLVVDDPSIVGINLSLSDAVTTEEDKAIFMSELNKLLIPYKKSLNIYKTGSVVIDHAFDVSVQNDLESLYLIFYVLVFLLIGLLTRSIVAVLGIFLTVTFSWVITLGITGYLGIKLTAISASAPTILMTLAVAQCMHIIFSVQKSILKGSSTKESVQSAIKDNIGPLFFVTLSTFIGFIALNSSEVPPLRDLGLILAIGMTVIYFLVIFFLPSVISYFHLHPVKFIQKSQRKLGSLGTYVAENSNKILFIAIIPITILWIPFSSNIINDNFIEYFDESIPIRTDSEFINSHLTGVHHIYFDLQSSKNDGIFSPDYLQYVDKLSSWLETQKEVSNVISITDIFKRLHKAAFGGTQDQYLLPTSKKLTSQLYLLYEMSLPLGLTTSNLVDMDKKSSRLTIIVKNITSAEILALEEKIKVWSNKNQSSEVTLSSGTGPAIMFAHIGQSNSESLLIGSIKALLFVSVLLLIYLKSISLSLISLIPNLLPAFIAFGIWGLVDGEVGLAISIVAIMTFGIVVDDTIYLMTHFKKNSDALSFNERIAKTYQEVGIPIIQTTIILTVGFSVLAFSDFRLNQGMGILTALIITIALILDLLLLPILIKLTTRKSIPDEARAVPHP